MGNFETMSADEFQAEFQGKKPPGRKHIQATPTKRDGFRFDSKTEALRYDYLKAHPHVLHIDVHPVFTLSTGRRYTADFLVFWDWDHPYILQAEDVKGLVGSKHESWRRFQLIREDFDKHHPLAPLHVVTLRDGGWVEV